MNIKNKKPLCIRTLNNGMKIALIKSNVPLFRIELVIRSGMLNETNKQVGFAHFIEHLMSFFPSSKYPDSKLNQQLMDNLNFVTNAWTSEHDCGFYIEGLMEYIPYALDLIFNNYIHPKLNPEVFEQERQAVIQELESMSNDIWYPLEHLIQSTLFKHTILQYSLIHEINNVKNCATVDNILDYRNKFYKPNNTVIMITSNMDEQTFTQLLKFIETNYFDTHRKIKNTLPKVVSKPTPKSGIYYIKPLQNTNTVNINIYFPVRFNQFHRKHYVVKAIDLLLTGGMGARLYYALRTSLGAVYNVHTSVDLDPTNQRNYFIIDFETRKDCAIDAFDHVMVELAELCNLESLPQVELDKIQNKLKYELIMNNSKASFKKCTELFSPSLIWNKQVKGLSEIHKIYQSITPSEILSLVREIFDTSNMLVFYSSEEPVLQNHHVLDHKSSNFGFARSIKKVETIVKLLRSPKKHKKYRVIVRNKNTKRTRIIDFGDKRYEQYRDSTKLKLYKSKNHNDKKRRKNYFKRHSGVESKRKALTKEWKKSKGKYTPKILSHQYLW